MNFVAGLGNIGMKYAHTRHNFGFMVIDHLLSRNLESELKIVEDADADAYVLRTMSDGENEFFVFKALGFMNLSGRPIRNALNRTECKASDLIVVHDDLDLELGEVRVKFGGGSGGHNGLKSIFEETGTNEFIRVRAGIGRPPGRTPAADYVLDEFTAKEMHEVAFAIIEAAHAVSLIVRDGLESAMNEINAR